MGVTNSPVMLFGLADLIPAHDGLDDLSLPITTEQINAVIKALPSDKAPGPDGFNGLFFKRCWYIIKEDFYKFCEDFFGGRVTLNCLNSSFITLVPKITTPETINDFRPISLINCCMKIITKILANRMQTVILSLIHPHQYGFIKSRSIQDCLAWSFEYIHQCHQSKREIIILKLDFAKVFDTVEHCVILQMLKALGCPDIWINWVNRILESGSSSVLLNGVPGKNFHCKRGVRQGDPLSPLLFVIAAELLQHIMNRGHQRGLFSLPIPSTTGQFPVVQYADDTLMILKADAKQLFCLKALLNSFATSTGLQVNFSKSMMIPINVLPEKMEILSNTFGCQVGSLSFTYLGLPLGTTKPKIEDFIPLMDKIERRLSCCSTFLSYSGRLEMINSVLSPSMIYSTCQPSNYRPG